VHLRLTPGEDNPPDSEFSQGLDVILKVLECDLPDLAYPPDVTHQATAIAAIVREQDEDRQRAKVGIKSRRVAVCAARNGAQLSQLNAHSEMQHKQRRHAAGRLKHGVLPRCPEDAPFRFAEIEISRVYETETFGFKRPAKNRQVVDESLDFHCPIRAPKGTPPSPGLRIRVHVGDKDLGIRPRDACQFACKRRDSGEMADGKRAYNNIRRSWPERKSKSISDNEAAPKQRLVGGAPEHLAAGIDSHRRARTAIEKSAEPSACPTANIQGLPRSQIW
jgi:hypothetical protein